MYLNRQHISTALIVTAVILFSTACAKAPRPPQTTNLAPTSTSPPPRTTTPRPQFLMRKGNPTSGDSLAAALDSLDKGNLAYNTPQKMKTGETGRVTAVIGGSNISVSILQSSLPTGSNQASATAATPVSPSMKMTLTSPDFDITNLSSAEQIVAGNTPTKWEWDIVPKHSGKLGLHLAATVELNGLSRDFTTIDRDIPVQVDPVGAAESFVRNNWQWLIATLATVGGAAWKFLRSRKKTATPTVPGDAI